MVKSVVTVVSASAFTLDAGPSTSIVLKFGGVVIGSLTSHTIAAEFSHSPHDAGSVLKQPARAPGGLPSFLSGHAPRFRRALKPRRESIRVELNQRRNRVAFQDSSSL